MTCGKERWVLKWWEVEKGGTEDDMTKASGRKHRSDWDKKGRCHRQNKMG